MTRERHMRFRWLLRSPYTFQIMFCVHTSKEPGGDQLCIPWSSVGSCQILSLRKIGIWKAKPVSREYSRCFLGFRATYSALALSPIFLLLPVSPVPQDCAAKSELRSLTCCQWLRQQFAQPGLPGHVLSGAKWSWLLVKIPLGRVTHLYI